MAAELRDWFNPALFDDLADRLSLAYPPFDRAAFIEQAAHDLDALSLTQRMTQTCRAAQSCLPSDFRPAVEVLRQVAPAYKGQFVGMFMPEFVATYGLEDRDYALNALEYFTRYSSSEFAIRHFLRADFDHTIGVMMDWARSDNEHVRRLASEGARPRLPWSFNLDRLIENPAPVRPILEALKSDDALYVRKSVANHLNDISKDHPETMLDWITSWDLSDTRTAWIAKRAARSLIKAGHPRSFAIFGFEADPAVAVSEFQLSSNRVRIGGEIRFSFALRSKARRPQKLAVDYAVHYQKKNGRMSPKVFKLKEFTLPAGETTAFTRLHRFADLTTRRHHAGRHAVELLVNGTSCGKRAFTLQPN